MPDEVRSLDLKPGALVGHFQLDRVIGVGGFGVVFEARDTQLGRPVALKVLSSKLFSDETARARFIREAQLASSITHTNVATIYEVGEQEGSPFIAMELVRGANLKELLSKGALPVRSVASIGRQVSEALQAAHEHGVIHRDVKSSNIMVTAEGRAKVLDFGLAKAMRDVSGLSHEHVTPKKLPAGRGSAWPAEAPAEEDVTARGFAVGTPSYMSPEQASGHNVDRRTDIYSLGVVLYEAASGRLPFQGGSDHQLLKAILDEEPTPLSLHARGAGVPASFARVVSRCLAKNPKERFQSCVELAEVLGRIEEGGGLRLPALRRGLPVVAATLLLAGAAGVIYVWRDTTLQMAPSRATDRAVAVLPPHNLGPPEDDYLAAGIAETLINKLSTIRRFRVSSWSATRRFDRETNPLEAGRSLGVDTIVESSVQRLGARLLMTVQLVRVEDGSQFWAREFDEPMSDVLEIQSSVASSVASELALELAEEPFRRASFVGTTNVDAYELYLRGRYAFYKYDPADNETAIGWYRRALDVDSGFALAHAGLALAYLQYKNAMWDMDPIWLDRAMDSARRAIELAPGIADSHFALGSAHFHRGDLDAATKAFQRTIELNPSHAHAHSYLGNIQYQVEGEFDLAAVSLDRALLLDPFLISAIWHRGILNALEGDFTEATHSLRRAQELYPASPYTWLYTAVLHLYSGDAGLAALAIERMMSIEKDHPLGLFLLAFQAEQVQDEQKALNLYETILSRHPRLFAGLAGRARVLHRMHRSEDALAAVDAALATPEDPDVLLYFSHRTLSAMRSVLLERLGRTEESDAARESSLALAEDASPTPLVEYQIAKSLAISGSPDRAASALARAVEGGFRAFRLMRVEPDLAALAGHPEFERLLESRQ